MRAERQTQRTRVKSSYFPEEESREQQSSSISAISSAGSNGIAFSHAIATPTTPSNPDSRAPLSRPTASPQYEEEKIPKFSPAIHFPSHRGVLWNRSNYGNPEILTPTSILSALRISPVTAVGLVEQLLLQDANRSDSANAQGAIDITKSVLTGLLVSSGDLTDDELQAMHSHVPSAIKPENYVLSLSSDSSFSDLNSNVHVHTEETVSVPLSLRDSCDMDLFFEENATRNLVSNLGKGLCKGRAFSLRSILRLRASARVHSTGDEGGSRVTTPIRFEMITPNVSFEAVQVGTIPIFTSASTSRLLEDQLRSNMGYITLNQTRQLVLLHSSSGQSSLNYDHITSPVVGVWVTMPSMRAPENFRPDYRQDGLDSSFCPLSVLQNPFIWGACVKYLLTEHVQDKVWVAPATFLLTLFTNFGVFHFEIKALSATRDIAPLLPLEDLTFTCQEYCTDLAAEAIAWSSPSRPSLQGVAKPGHYSKLVSRARDTIFGKLRCSVTPSYIKMFPVHPEHSRRPSRIPIRTNNDSQRRPSPSRYAIQNVDEGNNNNSEPDERCSITNPENKSNEDMVKRHSLESTEQFASPGKLSVVSMDAFLAQQREIDRLKAQIALLQEELAISNANAITGNNIESVRPESFGDNKKDKPQQEAVGITASYSYPENIVEDSDENVNSETSDSDAFVNSDAQHEQDSYHSTTHEVDENDDERLNSEDYEDETQVSIQFVRNTFQPLEAPSLFDLDIFEIANGKTISSSKHSEKTVKNKQVNSKCSAKDESIINCYESTTSSGSGPLDALLPVTPPSHPTRHQLPPQPTSHGAPIPFSQPTNEMILICDDVSVDDTEGHDKSFNDDETESMILIQSKYM